ncbi:MAG: serine aminopeptidase domain-containing protein [Planctomycetota bacterium]|jgi:pimeloyl-ACP methyl ester carboxylesterase
MATASPPLERTGWIPSGGGGVYAFLSKPAEPRGAGCVLLAPLADERKSSLRSMVDVARGLAARGIAALRIDYRGTGDSSGTSVETTLASMTEDAAAGADYMRDECGCGKVALAGLRLGGAAALLAAERARADAIVMMEPVVDGASYVRELRRRQSIRRMLTKGKGAAEDEGDADRPFDLDGTALDPAFVAEMGELDLVEAARRFSAGKAARSFVLQVGPRRAASRGNASLAEALGEGARLSVLRAEPFWLQTDYVDPAPAEEEVARFLGDALLGEALLDEPHPGEAPSGQTPATRGGGGGEGGRE